MWTEAAERRGCNRKNHSTFFVLRRCNNFLCRSQTGASEDTMSWPALTPMDGELPCRLDSTCSSSTENSLHFNRKVYMNSLNIFFITTCSFRVTCPLGIYYPWALNILASIFPSLSNAAFSAWEGIFFFFFTPVQRARVTTNANVSASRIPEL